MRTVRDSDDPETAIPRDISRRGLLGGMAFAPLLTVTEHAAAFRGLQGPGLVIREKDPENLEYPFETLDSYITPNEQFFVRSHFKVPAMDATTWKLAVEGSVSSPLSLSLDDLKAMPSQTVPVTLECAGNSRVFLSPAVTGAQWELGAVSNAEWTGVPLAAVLERAGVKSEAVEVILEGADAGAIKADPKPPDAFHFARSVPISKVKEQNILLAYAMNGAPLPASHGFPLRAIVPGWYGVASVKWLTKIIAADKPFSGHFQTVDYAYWERREGLPSRIMITELLVKSEISKPQMHEVVRAGKEYRVSGAAWTSGGEIANVQVSVDGGSTWADAKLIGKSTPHTWRLWEFGWKAPSTSGKVTLMSKATDSMGRVQPMTRDADRVNYMINHVLPIEVIVR